MKLYRGGKKRKQEKAQKFKPTTISWLNDKNILKWQFSRAYAFIKPKNNQ